MTTRQTPDAVREAKLYLGAIVKGAPFLLDFGCDGEELVRVADVQPVDDVCCKVRLEGETFWHLEFDFRRRATHLAALDSRAGDAGEGVTGVLSLFPNGWKVRQVQFSAPCADDRKWHVNVYGGREGRDAFVGRGATAELALMDAATQANPMPATPAPAVNASGGWIVSDADGVRWRAWENGSPAWTEDRQQATRYHRREDAEAVHGDDEDAWRAVPFGAGAAIGSIRYAMERVADLSERWADSLVSQINKIARGALANDKPATGDDLRQRFRDASRGLGRAGTVDWPGGPYMSMADAAAVYADLMQGGTGRGVIADEEAVDAVPAGEVERIAQAIYEEDDPWHKAWPWPNLNPEAQSGPAAADRYREIARAVLAALSHGEGRK